MAATGVVDQNVKVTSLRERGVESLFVCRTHGGHLCDLIDQRGFDAHRLPTREGASETAHDSCFDARLGASWEHDAEQTAAGIEALAARPTWLIVDHYSLDQRWERE